MNAETLQVISYLLDQHLAKDSLIKSLGDRLDKIEKEQHDAKQAMVPPPEPIS